VAGLGDAFADAAGAGVAAATETVEEAGDIRGDILGEPLAAEPDDLTSPAMEPGLASPEGLVFLSPEASGVLSLLPRGRQEGVGAGASPPADDPSKLSVPMEEYPRYAEFSSNGLMVSTVKVPSTT
jgi:hypothetical protein